MQEPTDLSATVPELLCFLLSLGFCYWYQHSKHWLANNALGLAFSIQGIEHLSLGAVQTGVILLSGLFVYDIFWVFFTPVMVCAPRQVHDTAGCLQFTRSDKQLPCKPVPPGCTCSIGIQANRLWQQPTQLHVKGLE